MEERRGENRWKGKEEMGKRQICIHKKEWGPIGGREGKEVMNESKYFRLDDGRTEKLK